MAMGNVAFTLALADLADQFNSGALTKAEYAADLAALYAEANASVLVLGDKIDALLAIKAAMIDAYQAGIGLRGTVTEVSELPADAGDGAAYKLVNVADALDGHLFARVDGAWEDLGLFVGQTGRSTYEAALEADPDLGLTEEEFALYPITQTAAAVAQISDALAEGQASLEATAATAAATSATADQLLAQATDILDGIPSLGFNGVTIEVEAEAGTQLGALPSTHTYTLLDGAAGKVVMSGGLPVLADDAPSTPTSWVFVIQAIPVNGGQVLTWALKVRVTTDLVNLILSSLTIPIEASEGDEIGTLSAMTDGSTLSLAPDDGRFYLDGETVKRGAAAIMLGDIAATLTETLDGARNSPHDTALTLTVVKSFDYYVDSTGGSDSYDGLTPATAFATSAKLATVSLTGKKVGFRKARTYPGNVVITANNLLVGAYGPTGDAKPLLDDSRLITGWTATVGRTNVWQSTITLPNSVKTMGNLTKNDTLMPQVSSEAACEAAAGSCYVPTWNAASSTVFVQSATDPNLDVYRHGYDIALSIIGTGTTVQDIASRLNGAQDGSQKLTGENGLVQRLDVSLGARHAYYAGFGVTFSHNTFSGARNDLEPPGNANLVVVNQPDPSGKSWFSNDNMLSSGGYPLVTGWQNHGADAEALCVATYHTRDTYDRLVQTADVQAADYKEISPTFINVDQGLYVGRGTSAVIEVTDAVGTINRIFEAARPATIKFLDGAIVIPMVGGATVGWGRADSPTGDVTLEIRDYTIEVVSAANINARLLHMKRGLTKIFDTVIKPVGGLTLTMQLDHVLVAGFSGGAATFQGDRNVYPYGAAFLYNGTLYPTLAAWQAYWVSQGQTHDAASTTQQPKAASFSDAFTRADENLEVTWTRIGGSAAQAAVRSNTLAAIGTTQTAYRLGNMASADMYARFTIKAVPGTPGPVVALRLVDQNNWWGLRWNGTTFQFGKCVGGVHTVSVQPSTVVAPAVDQDVVVAIRGDRVWLYVDGRLAIRGQAAAEATLAAAVGVGVVTRITTMNPWIDDLKFGDL